ncbi:hypothetical protein COT42_03590 [Candidatus Saganbacteria bacterium CG08_land_8_20_14_0_20_45_16]|uniref:RND efflux pump membrane fusion protein barrel-sandwich domain-containing protein n=1 Tax=Candidatus Saganbacteria bacterium CG08_land_8_20_14_0_20_45_16 TaxID=2014293 RepID=A0A2H0XZ04_UNCSA|nr:MAG: hypothetical protein COT42_03590 [Candidatus Saganbacteria bacterium CG08_land_8_20_14_0_20_45_16]
MNRKQIFWIIGVLIMAFVIYRLVAWMTIPRKVEEKERVISVVVATPKSGEISEKLTLTGDIKGETEVMVRPKTMGRVEEIYVKEGDEVAKGDKLLSYVAGISPDDELYEDMVTFAPVSGVVGMQLIKLGEQVTSQMGVVPPVFTIYKIDNVKVLADVSEKYYSALYRGMRAEIRLDAYPDRVFIGKVINIRPVVDPLSRTTQVEILVANPGYQVKPGMFCKVDLILKKKTTALLIPADAVLGDTEKYVFVVEAGKAVKKPVKTGIQENNTIEIIAGLSSSDQVIVVGQRVVEEGSKVKVEVE